MTQCPFPNFSELQLRVDGVNATPRRRDPLDVAVRESTRLARESRRCRDAVVTRRDMAGDIGLDPFYKLVFPTMAMLTQEHQDLLNNACDEGDPKAIKATVRSRVHRTMPGVVSFPISMLRAGRNNKRGPESPPRRPENVKRAQKS